VNNIQVQRGVGASSNGAGAFGASINFQTNELKEKPYANVISTAGSFDTYRNTIAAGTGLLNNKFTLDARASKITSQGYIDRAASDLSSYYLAAGYYGKKSVLKFINFTGREKTYQAWNYVNEDSIKAGNRTYNEIGQYTDANGRLQFYKNQTDNYNQNNSQLHFIHQVNSKMSFNLTGHYTKGKGYYEEYKEDESFSKYGLADPGLLINDSVPVTSTDIIRRRWLDNDFVGGLFNFNYTAASNLNFILGGGYNTYYGRHFGRVIWAQYASDSETDHEYYHNTANKNDANVYIKTNYKPLAALNVFVDLQVRKVDYRFYGIDQTFMETTQTKSFVFFNPKAGLSYNLNKAMNVYASVAVGNKEPNRNDFVENTPGNRPKHEELLDMEAGAKYAAKKITASVNFYNMQYKNQLVLNGELNDVGAAKRINVDESLRRGIEVELAAELNRYFSIGGNLALSQNKIKKFVEHIDSSNADYSVYTQHVNEYSNTDISFSPNVVASAFFTIKPVKNLEVSFINKYVGRQYLDNTSNIKRSINPYNSLNLQLNYTVKTKLIPEISFMLSVYNLLNAQYETTGYTFSYYYDSPNLTTTNYLAPSAPLNFLGGISLKF
jgi:iron complex outermembrane receptor protein